MKPIEAAPQSRLSLMKENSQKDSKKLLLIDDDPNLILLVKDYLEFRGYQVMTAENGREALDILEQNIPDMIICDVMMPEIIISGIFEKNLVLIEFPFCSSLLKVKVKTESKV